MASLWKTGCFMALAALAALTAAARVGAAEPSANQIEFFETRVRPLLVEKCVRCHGPQKQKADLRLDTAEGVKRGGEYSSPRRRR